MATGLSRPFVGSFMTFTIVESTATKEDQLLLKDKYGDRTGRRAIQPTYYGGLF